MYFQLVPKTHRIEEIGFGLLPTPTTQEPTTEAELTETGRRKTKDGKSSHSLNLGRVASMLPTPKYSGLLPTPAAMDHNSPKNLRKDAKVSQNGFHSMSLTHFMAEGLLPTPTANDTMSPQEGRIIVKNGRYVKKNKGTGTEYGPKLVDIAGLLPTPAAVDWKQTTLCESQRNRSSLPGLIVKNFLPTPATRDYKGARSTEALQAAGRSETNSLPDYFHQTGKTSQLNPRFVMEMMGFPPDWTELPFLNGETNP